MSKITSPRRHAFHSWFGHRIKPFPEHLTEEHLHLAFDAGWDARGDNDASMTMEPVAEAIKKYQERRAMELMRKASQEIQRQNNPIEWLLGELIRLVGP